jgi:NAD(P) transhydrogenase subunit beta
MTENILTLIYILASVSFIAGLKMLSHPLSARKGNLLAAGGMALAIFATIFLYRDPSGQKLHNHVWIFLGLLIGTVAGTIAAKKVKMTAMPEMVSLFNGMGGACAALISLVEYDHWQKSLAGSVPVGFSGIMVIILLGLIIGTISFSGSIIAWGKLNGKIRDYSFRSQQIISMGLMLIILLLGAYVMQDPNRIFAFYLLFAFCLLYGVLFVMPIGGADMPVVISLLNSFTGVAAACGGFLYDNKVMLTGGVLVGAAGTLLTILMCKAMNRSLKNVLIGSFGSASASVSVSGAEGSYKEISLSDAATLMNFSNKVMIVPGYGLAVAQAQHTCHELEKMLTEKGVEVKYAIHPVAGRMPGHMNVLLAEADVNYDKLLEMEQANDEFKNTDVVLILGANDVVNPAAKSDPSSPIYGMPILEVEQARHVIVNKRSMKPGYAGIENGLFFQPKTSMLFGDAKKVLQDLCSEIKTM